MKFLPVFSVLASAVVSVLGQTIQLGYPSDGTLLSPGQSFDAQVIRPLSLSACQEVGIALSIAPCDNNGDCPQPTEELGFVLYAGPFNYTPHNPGGFYQNFTLQVPTFMPLGPAVFTLTHLCLLGAGPIPLLEYRNASLDIVVY